VAPQLIGQRLVVDNGEFTVGPREARVKGTNPREVARKRSRLHDDHTVELDAPRSFRGSEGQQPTILLPIA